ncbi:hypothetical protein [Synechococcus sp. CBW1107]|uniref:hypothetical protein n=1 Tax=Synechococcus sp. CBW1107 TaxID=2789857 RepID=UPI002AD3F8EB|nr:hypothetical protein [Synechococcus sp. CBW1107]CAK6697077.1 hypothetical protein ICNINCKA_02157 [Synechococcus sp. CBW1107]
MAAPFPSPSQGPLKPGRGNGSAGKGKPIAPPPQNAPADPFIGRIDLTPYAIDATPGEDGLVAEISASLYIGNKLYTISSGGSNLVTLTTWKDPSNPQFVQQLDLSGFFTTSVASFGNLIAIAATPENYEDPDIDTPESQIRFYKLNPSGKLSEVAW